MSVALDSAMYQWREGEQRVRDAPHLDTAVHAVIDGLRHRLGSTFQIEELGALYHQGTDWAEEVAARRWAGAESVAVVDAAFARYAREAADFAGGRRYVRD